ncbi:MAG: hypothetical protein ACRCSU_15475 [Paracoccaceae bacterium]
MIPAIDDPALPGLAQLSAETLARITGAEDVQLLRLRYQPGARAVLHVAFTRRGSRKADEGAIWFFAGNKAARLASKTAGAIHDDATAALFQAFPQDHRLPQLTRFTEIADELAPGVIGGRQRQPPEALRYRPGLSATFRWVRQDGACFYAKLLPNEDVRLLSQRNALLAGALTAGRPISEVMLAVPPVSGIAPDLGVIAYASAPGHPLDRMLAGASAPTTASLIAQVVGALPALWSCSIVPPRVLDRAALLARAEQAVQMTRLVGQGALELSLAALDRLLVQRPRVRLRPIHADMKLEHAFVHGQEVTLVDMESLSLGDPDYDLAAVEARLQMAALTAAITGDQLAAARTVLRHAAGPDYGFFLGCARLQCARFFAQRLHPEAAMMIHRILRPD